MEEEEEEQDSFEEISPRYNTNHLNQMLQMPSYMF